jgi:hypothetical protein
MLTVLLVWAVYLLASVLRKEAPEKWTWGIAPGVYAALYRPGLGKPRRQAEHQRDLGDDDDDEPERRPARRRARPAGDE